MRFLEISILITVISCSPRSAAAPPSGPARRDATRSAPVTEAQAGGFSDGHERHERHRALRGCCVAPGAARRRPSIAGLDPQGRPVATRSSARCEGRAVTTSPTSSSPPARPLRPRRRRRRPQPKRQASPRRRRRAARRRADSPPTRSWPRCSGSCSRRRPSTANAAADHRVTSVPVGTAQDAAGGEAVKALPVPGHAWSRPTRSSTTASSSWATSSWCSRRGPPPRRRRGSSTRTPDENKASILSLKQQLANETVDIVCTAHGGCTPKGLGGTLLDDLISRLGT